MDTNQSLEIGELAGALAVAQGKITGALKDSANPFFKSKYADLASVWDACRAALADNGLAVIQTTRDTGHGITVVTTLAHKSGQWIRGELTMIPKDQSPQGYGSAITYARRYALAAIVGVAQVDDDANQASGKADHETPEHAPTYTPNELAKAVADMRAAIDADTDEDGKARAVGDVHDRLRFMADLYSAASDEAAKSVKNFKSAWKAYVRRCAELDKTMLANGRAAA